MMYTELALDLKVAKEIIEKCFKEPCQKRDIAQEIIEQVPTGIRRVCRVIGIK